MTFEVRQGDCVEAMVAMPAGSVDSVVCDPPYGLEFMGKDWDRLQADVGGRDDLRASLKGERDPGGEFGKRIGIAYGAPNKNPRCRRCYKLKHDHEKSRCKCEHPDWDLRKAEYGYAMQWWHQAWATEALRVLKPGGHLLAFGGTRTYHRLACAVEDAGFEIRDTISWLYGSGFPKSLDVSKSIDRASPCPRCEGRGFLASGLTCPQCDGTGRATRKAIRRRTDGRYAYEFKGTANRPTGAAAGTEDAERIGGFVSDKAEVTAPATPEAERWEGWGTALKPAHEPVVVARKPLSGTVAANCLEHGTGALNVDGCRVGSDGGTASPLEPNRLNKVYGDGMGGLDTEPLGAGRWPANVVLDGEAARLLDEQTGERAAGRFPANTGGFATASGIYGHADGRDQAERNLDAGGASRFFYVAKASRGERGAGLNGAAEGDGKICVCQGDEPSEEPSPLRATDEPAGTDDSRWSTSGSGSKPTDPSPTDTKSTTETATDRTTTSPTLSSSRPPTTSASTPPTTDATPPASGNGAAGSAASGSPPTPSTTTSAEKAGHSTADADPATSPGLSKPSSSDVCPDCGGVVQGALRNSHPT